MKTGCVVITIDAGEVVNVALTRTRKKAFEMFEAIVAAKSMRETAVTDENFYMEDTPGMLRYADDDAYRSVEVHELEVQS